MAVRARVLVPPPHVLEQVDHLPKPLTWQSMGQAKVLQAVTCLRPAQPRPPKADCLMTERVRVLEPVLQVWVQAEKADQGETLQSTGQALVLQGTVWLRTPCMRPPWAGLLMTERERVL